MYTTFVSAAPSGAGAFVTPSSLWLRHLQSRPTSQVSTCSRHLVLNLSIRPSDNPSTVAQGTSVQDEEFTQWAKSQDIRMSSIVLTTSHNEAHSKSHPSVSSRGLQATEAIQKGASLVTVPSKCALQVTSTADESVPEQFPIPKPEWRRLPWFARLALLLISARKDKNHPLHPWTKRLPSAVDAPHHWTDSEIAQLQDQRMASLIKTQRHSYKNCFHRIRSALPQTKSISYEEFLWAVDCIRSRAFAGPLEPAPFRDRLRLTLFVAVNTFLWPSLHVLPWENAINGGLTAIFSLFVFDVIFPRIQRIVSNAELRRYAIVPVIDMFNHNGIEARDSQVEYRYFTESFNVLSAKNYSADNEVFISYGKQSNDAFLQYYAFVEDDNPADTFVFGDDLAAELGMSQGSLVVQRNGFDPKVVRAVKKRLGGDTRKTLTLLREMCRAHLSQYETTADQDSSILKEVKSRRMDLAVRYRRAKKLLLHGIVDKWEGKEIKN